MLKVLHNLYHTFENEERRCEVWKDEDGSFVTRHYTVTEYGILWQKDVSHRDHSERWSEDAAENWVDYGDRT